MYRRGRGGGFLVLGVSEGGVIFWKNLGVEIWGVRLTFYDSKRIGKFID